MIKPQFTTGTVSLYDPKTCTCVVHLHDGGTVSHVPVLNAAGGPMSNDANPIPDLRGAQVLMQRVDSRWYVCGTLPQPGVSGTSVSLTNTGTGGENKETYGKTTLPDFSGGRATDALPGDKVMSAGGGASVLLGRDGLALLKASPRAQLILGAHKDFAKLIARDLSVYTDFGMVRFAGGGPDGTTGISIIGGANYCDESSTSGSVGTVKIFIGDVPGDSGARYSMEISSTDGSEHVSVVVRNDGTIDINTTQDAELQVGNDLTTKVAHDEYHYVVGDQIVVIGENPQQSEDDACNLFESEEDGEKAQPSGNRSVHVKKDDILMVDGSTFTTVDGDSESVISGESTEKIAGEREVTVAQKETHTAVGGLTLNCGPLRINAASISFGSTNGFGPTGGAYEVTCPGINFKKSTE